MARIARETPSALPPRTRIEDAFTAPDVVAQSAPDVHGPVIASVTPGLCRLANSHFPSGL